MFFILRYGLGLTPAAVGAVVDFSVLLLLDVCVALSFSSGTVLLKTSLFWGDFIIIIVITCLVPIPAEYTLPLLPDPPAHTGTSQAHWCPRTRLPVT